MLRYKIKSDSYLYIRVVSRGTRALGLQLKTITQRGIRCRCPTSCTHSRRANRGKTAQNKVNKRSHEMRAKWSKLPLAAQCRLCSIIDLKCDILSNTSDIIGLFFGSSFISCRHISSSASRSADGQQEAHSSCNVFPQDHKSARIAL